MNRWMVLQCDYGQLGNRLHTHANALAWCIENNVNLLNLSFQYFAINFGQNRNQNAEIFTVKKGILNSLFANLLFQNILTKICMSEKWLNRLSFLLDVIRREDHEMLTEREIDEAFISTKLIVVVRAWNLNCSKSINHHESKIRQILCPIHYDKNLADSYIRKLRNRYDIIVGVHARRGDYQKFLDGKYYYSWTEYKDWITNIIKVFKESKKDKVGILICSDEIVDIKLFKSLPVNISEKPTVINDMLILSLCDYNIGPPSSLGTWISWYGKVPRFSLEDKNSINSIDQFKICLTC